MKSLMVWRWKPTFLSSQRFKCGPILIKLLDIRINLTENPLNAKRLFTESCSDVLNQVIKYWADIPWKLDLKNGTSPWMMFRLLWIHGNFNQCKETPISKFPSRWMQDIALQFNYIIVFVHFLIKSTLFANIVFILSIGCICIFMQIAWFAQIYIAYFNNSFTQIQLTFKSYLISKDNIYPEGATIPLPTTARCDPTFVVILFTFK